MAARKDYPEAEVCDTISGALDLLDKKDGRKLWKSDGCYIVAGTIGQATDAIVTHKELKPVVMTMEASMKALRDEMNAK